jgi:hypothetical protein
MERANRRQFVPLHLTRRGSTASFDLLTIKHQQTLGARSFSIGDTKTLRLLLTASKIRDLKATGKTDNAQLIINLTLKP